MNHCRLAHDMLRQTVIERRPDIVLISDPLYNPGDWIMNGARTAAIWVTGVNRHQYAIQDIILHEAFVLVRSGDLTFISAYLSPNKDEEFVADVLDIISSHLTSRREDIILGGDINAKSPVWGSRLTDGRGLTLMSWLDGNRLIPTNPSGGPTFIGKGTPSRIDILAATFRMFGRLTLSHVLQDLSGSYHNYVMHSFKMRGLVVSPPPVISAKWSVRSLRMDPLVEAFSECTQHLDSEVLVLPDTMKVIAAVRIACDASMKWTGGRVSRRVANHWWSPEIAELRTLAKKARRVMTRVRVKYPEVYPVRREAFCLARKKLNWAIRIAKDEVFLSFCEELRYNVWGRPYTMVMKFARSRAPMRPLSGSTVSGILDNLFPLGPLGILEEEIHDIRNVYARGSRWGETDLTIPPVTEEALTRAIRQMSTGKAAGLDGVPQEAIKALAPLLCSRPCSTAYWIEENILIHGSAQG